MKLFAEKSQAGSGAGTGYGAGSRDAIPDGPRLKRFCTANMMMLSILYCSN